MRQLLYIFLLFSTVNPSFGQADSSLHLQEDKKKASDYIILNGYREDTIWCEVTKIENNQIYYTTPNKDEWVKDFQDICNLNGKVIHCERTYMPPSNQWEYIGHFDHGYARVWNETRGAYIDSTGKCESDCPFKDIGRFHNGYTWSSNDDGEINIINKKCEIKFSRKYNMSEHGVAFFDSIIVIYGLNDSNNDGNMDGSFGAIDYNFKIVIPFIYANILNSSSNRYYFVSKCYLKNDEGECQSGYGIYDVVDKKEIVPCRFKGSVSGQGNSDGTGFINTFEFEDAFFKEMEKLKITLPDTDEISDQINGVFKW